MKRVIVAFAAIIVCCLGSFTIKAEEDVSHNKKAILVKHQSITYKVLQDEIDGITDVELVCPDNDYNAGVYNFPDNYYLLVPDYFIEKGKTYRVVSIGNQALKNVKVNVLEVPSTVKHIGDYAFSCARIKVQLILPDELELSEVGEYILHFTNVGLFEIPKSWKKIEKLGSEITCIDNLVLHDDVETICTDAFVSNSRIQNIYCGKGLKTIEPGAFNYSSFFKAYMQPVTPPECTSMMENKSIGDIPYLYVLPECVEEYRAHPVFGRMCAIIPRKNLTDLAGVEKIVDTSLEISGGHGCIIATGSGNETMEVYDMNGRKVYNGVANKVDGLTRGVYIVKSGTNVAKVMVR